MTWTVPAAVQNVKHMLEPYPVQAELMLKTDVVRTFEHPGTEHGVHFHRARQDTSRGVFVHGLISSLSSVVVFAPKQSTDRP